LRISRLWPGVDTENDMYSVWLVRLSKSSPKTSKFLQRSRNNSESRPKLRLFLLWPSFEAESGMHSVWLVKLSKSSPKTSKYVQRLRNISEFRSNSSFPRLWPSFDPESGMHSVWLVKLSKSSPKTLNTSSGGGITVNFDQNCVYLGYGLVSTLKVVYTVFCL
jgi:hypothetical protein